MSEPGRHELWRGVRSPGAYSGINDPFAVNPIRRSCCLVSVCLIILIVPWLISDEFGTSAMLAVGWLAITGCVMGIPILLWSLAEAGIAAINRRLHPSITELELSPRVHHILSRHGFQAIRDVDASSDEDLLLLSNMDTRALREIRRSIALWKYRRWQESGFAPSEAE